MTANMDIKEFLMVISSCEKSTDLCQYLGKLYGEYLTAISRKSNIILDELSAISRILHKHARTETPEKAFVCGLYSAKFERFHEDIMAMKREEKILSVLSSEDNQNLFTFLFKNGCCDYEYIKQTFQREDLLKVLDEFAMAGLAWCSELPTVTYFELTAAGYAYYSKTIGRWRK
jgi:hypothetical protein